MAARWLPWVMVAVLGLGLFALANRQRQLAERVELLERRPPTPPAEAPVGVEAPATRPAAALERPASLPPSEPSRPAPVVPAPAAEAFTPAQRAELAKEVERALRERGGPTIGWGALEDPMAVMEKELGLSPAQKLRVQALWKRRDAELMKGVDEGFQGNPGEHFKKLKEVEERYDEEIKRELDFAQREKYDALKKEGKLQPGVLIRVEVDEKK